MLCKVVDEFFVPALEAMAEQMDISPDVAGATLMAAGGSAPELFTSFIGTFQESDIGFAAIVGSAVFNVLFVIGCCALASPEPLELTWWPLARDCTYYALGLAVLTIFFIGTSAEKIFAWEAGVLLALYLGYVIFMKYNENVRKWLVETFSTRKIVEGEEISLSHAERMDAAEEQRLREIGKRKSQIPMRAGFMNILLKDDWEWDDVASARVLTIVSGDVEETFNKLDVDGDGQISKNELGRLLEGLDVHVMEDSINGLMHELDKNGDGIITFDEFSLWYLRSEQRILNELKSLFEMFDFNNSRTLDLIEVSKLLETQGMERDEALEKAKKAFQRFHIPISEVKTSVVSTIPVAPPSPIAEEIEMEEKKTTEGDGVKYEASESASESIKKFDKTKGESTDGLNFQQFQEWFVRTEVYRKKLKLAEKTSADAQGIAEKLRFPENFWGQFWFLVTIVLVILMIFTIPDVRKPGKAKYAIFSFVLSILWIGIFSWFMVEWTTIVGDTLHIPSVVMGLTFLAAGTSVPDLLSSMIVAKNGYGDMAVSSSIGSNIFDILVGLPLPWLAYNLIKGEEVIVAADNLPISIMILLGMIVIVILTIHFSGWKMTKPLGWTMFILYFLFLAQDLARTDYDCKDS